MRVSGKHDGGVRFSSFDESDLGLLQQIVDAIEGVPHVQPEIGRDLIVSAPTGVEFSADVADPFDQPALDVHVDVFEFRSQRQVSTLDLFENLAEVCADQLGFVVGQQTDFGQHLRVGLRSADVDFRQSGVKTD